MPLYSVLENLRNRKTIQFFILLTCVFYLASEPAAAQTNPNNRAFVGNLLGSFIGGLIGAGVTTATGYASGGLDDADKVLYGLYAGSIIGSTIGSTLVVHSKEKGGYGKLLLHAFLPHVIFSGTGLILSRVTETPYFSGYGLLA